MEVPKILVPLDFQKESINALKYAIKIAKLINAKITCLYVIEEVGYNADMFVSKEILDKIRREAEVKLSETAHNLMRDEKIKYEIIVTKGKVYSRIIDMSLELNVKFIVMGRSNFQDAEIDLIGTNASHIISRSLVPVITVRSHYNLTKGQFLLPLNLCRSNKITIKKAIDLALLLDLQVNILTVIKSAHIFACIILKKKHRKIKRNFEHHNIVCTTSLIRAKESVYNVIISFAKEIGVDFIFVMTRQEPDSSDYYISSLAKQIINKSKLPVVSMISNA